MADWNPALYSRFEDERTRPARDLLGRCRIGEGDGAGLRVADLGCGPGNSTALLAVRFPHAEVVGFDTSEAMLAAARGRLPEARFERADIGEWAPAEPFDLVFSNAALQWVPGHDRLIPALFRHVRPGGLLAVQIPDNLADPSQTAMRRIAAEAPFARTLAGLDEGREPILAREAYYDWLAGEAAEVDVWTTIYNHPMESPQAIADWFASTGLRPFLDPLDREGQAAFTARYIQEMDKAYPPRADGRRLLAFPRLFVVARRG